MHSDVTKWCCRSPAHGARLEIVPGDREATALTARAAADAPGTFYASHVFNPHFLHGTETYVHEMWEDLGGRLPDAIAVPVGNGTLLLGAALATEELLAQGLIERRPALIAVRAEAVSQLAAVRASGGTFLTVPEDRIRTVPEDRILAMPEDRILTMPEDRVLTMPEDRVLTAQLDLAGRGFYVETTGVACWAAVGDWTDRSVVVPLCGAGLKTGRAEEH